MRGPHTQGSGDTARRRPCPHPRGLIPGGGNRAAGTLRPRDRQFSRSGSMLADQYSFPSAVLAQEREGVGRSAATKSGVDRHDVGPAVRSRIRNVRYRRARRPGSAEWSDRDRAVRRARARRPADRTAVAYGGRLGPTASAEVYDPATGMFAATGIDDLASWQPRSHSALTDGRVSSRVATTVRWVLRRRSSIDLCTGTFSLTGSMTVDRRDHSSTLLADGRVLIAGGTHDPGPVACAGTSCIAMVGTTDLTSAEIYDPNTGKFEATGSMATPRAVPMAILLQDGRVLVAGGFTNRGLWSDAELYRP